MFIVGLLTWWYTAGWKQLGNNLLQKLAVSEDYFSVEQLLGSLFAPFKQISASSGASGGTLQMKLQAWFDKQFSRLIGAVVRLLIICIGIVWILLQAAVFLVMFLLWPLLPLAPAIGLLASLGGILL